MDWHKDGRGEGHAGIWISDADFAPSSLHGLMFSVTGEPRKCSRKSFKDHKNVY